jgi:hypothetical protein
MRISVLLPILTGASALWLPYQFSGQTPLVEEAPGSHVCPLPAKVTPPSDGFHSSHEFVQDKAVLKRQVNRLSRAVQVPSTSTELEDDPWSDYYAPFLELHDVFAELFPLVYVSIHYYLGTKLTRQTLVCQSRKNQPLRPRIHLQWQRHNTQTRAPDGPSRCRPH